MKDRLFVLAFTLLCGVFGAIFGYYLGGPAVPPAKAMPAVPRDTAVPLDTAFSNDSLEKEILRNRVLMEVESRFEKDMGLKAPFDNCEARGDAQYCTAVTLGGSPVSYRCTVDRCELECTPK